MVEAMTDQTPATEAGRALAEALGAGDIVGGEAVRVILAIEAEARVSLDDHGIERMAREHFESRRHFFEPPDGDVCSECGEGPDQDFVKVTMHFTDGDA